MLQIGFFADRAPRIPSPNPLTTVPELAGVIALVAGFAHTSLGREEEDNELVRRYTNQKSGPSLANLNVYAPSVVARSELTLCG
jgi:hypothetical protein